ncbi:MAG: GPW/gp25 family protein [Ramlibacter sp.]|nr:GPW/gp25 family protein [Ramlibacter sp.]
MHASAGFNGALGIGASMISAEPDIQQSLRILLATNPGERVMQPAYGCGIKRMVFEQMNESTLTEMRHLIEKSILFFEPRITVNEIAIDTDHWIDGELRIHIDYTVRTTNSRNNMVFPMYFREGTGVKDRIA